MVDLDEGYYLFKFAIKEDYHTEISGGPWIIISHYLTVKKWVPNFKHSQATEVTTAVWLWLPELPIEYYEGQSLYHITKRMGKPIKTYYNIASSSKGKYALVCVEVDLVVPAY